MRDIYFEILSIIIIIIVTKCMALYIIILYIPFNVLRHYTT